MMLVILWRRRVDVEAFSRVKESSFASSVWRSTQSTSVLQLPWQGVSIRFERNKFPSGNRFQTFHLLTVREQSINLYGYSYPGLFVSRINRWKFTLFVFVIENEIVRCNGENWMLYCLEYLCSLLAFYYVCFVEFLEYQVDVDRLSIFLYFSG